MTFRQLFEKYKNGTASPEEIALVEEELEKNEVINAYLASQLLEQPSLSLPPENTPQLHQVKSSVRRKFWMMTALCCAIVLLLGFWCRRLRYPCTTTSFITLPKLLKTGPITPCPWMLTCKFSPASPAQAGQQTPPMCSLWGWASTMSPLASPTLIPVRKPTTYR